jgi:hypothetical protein
MNVISLENVGSAIAAVAALGTASFGLVDASKGLWGGVSNIGWANVRDALSPFNDALRSDGHDWLTTIHANWINGLPKEDQKSSAKNLIRLGISAKNAASLAKAGGVDPTLFAGVATALEQGTALTQDQTVMLARLYGAIDAALDAGFELGDQRYRTVARLLAGVVAILLALVANLLWLGESFGTAFLVGLIAVPLAPIAKDLTSALTAAASALKGGK